MSEVFNLIHVTQQENILHIKLNNPQQLNILSKSVLKELSKIFQEASHDQAIKGILLSGEGKAFCAGADIKQLAALQGASGVAFARFGQMVFNQLERLGKPSVAALHGYVFGGGCELAMSATLRVAADNTIFSQPEIKLGIIPGFGGTQRLARLVGKAKALELCLTGERLNVQDALNFGLVNAISSQDQLIERSTHLLKQITQFSMPAIQGIMHSIHQGLEIDLDSAFELEAAHFGVCCSTADKKEGTNAFLEKRTPVFSGE